MSMELYTNALHSLRNSGICTKRKLSSDEADIALASILIFSRIELLTGEGSSGGYMTHIRGGLQLVKRLGERLPDSILTKTIVKKLRFLGFYDAVRHEQPYFMSRPPYNTIYLTHLGDADYLMHRIIEEAIELPNVLYEANNLDNLHYATQEQIRHGQLTAQHLLSRTAIVEDKVNQWLDMMASVTPYPKVIVTPSVDGAADYPQGLRIQFANCVSSCLWMFYWSLVVRLNRLIKQLHSLHSTLSAKLPDHPQLPASLINRIKDDSISDQYADNIGISLGTEITASTFHAQEALAFIFNLYAYWEERGNIEKTNWCIETLKMLESQGLSLYIQVNERQDKCAALTAAFLADRTKTLV
ncbi:hypothetical protein TARUN_1707 [Trichoderma arundinaceum]|uniref:Uncharacterized protein n=1 Tax=Trichoderma arundinaceum TaxID=490622 RepID=A0A395NWL2_TRIAR|nr:hypothetical protein TARUN_1707 [Trichoderma arundinaceum]